MRNKEHGNIPLRKKVLQPSDTGDVQMVCRFVEEKKAGLIHKSSSQQSSALITPGKLVERIIRVKPHAVNHGRRLMLQGPSVRTIYLILQVVQALNQSGVIGITRELLSYPIVVSQSASLFAKGIENNFQHRSGKIGRNLLIELGRPEIIRLFQFSAIRNDLTRQYPKES